MFVEIKIQCDCGTKYKFDVEPLHGRLPAAVHCPGCGVEGTEAANDQLRQKLNPSEAAPKKTEVVALLVEPASSRSTPGARSLETRPVSGERFAMGAAGAVIAASVAALAWFFLVKVTGYQIGFAAWGVGLLVGLGARSLGRQGSWRLGLMAAVWAFAAILVGQLFAMPVSRGASGTHHGFGMLTFVWLLLAAASAWRLGVSNAGPRTKLAGSRLE